MFDIFLSEDARKLVKKKTIVFLGDSNVRAMYKDFLCLLRDSKFIPQRILRNKMESTVYGDELIYHGQKYNGRNYREERKASINNTHVSFFFLTKVYNDYVEDVVEKITRRSKPDVIILNSCVWDITRWGCDGVFQFKDNLRFLMKKFRRLIPNCLVIWVTTPPVAAEMKGGFLVKELQFLKYSMRFHVVEANHFARRVVVENGFDVLDSHFHLQMQIHNRSPDGIHWEPKAVRYVTNLILRHISLSWNVPLPHRYESSVVDENLIAAGGNLYVEKVEPKKSAVKVKFDDSKESVVLKSNGKLQSIVTKVTGPEESKKKRRSSIQIYKVPKREEGIHQHIARKEKKARKRRIRRWKESIVGNTSQSNTSSFCRNSYTKNSTYDHQEQKSTFEESFPDNSFQPDQPNFNTATRSSCLPHSPVNNSHKSLHHNAQLVISPSQIPLPPDSPVHHQPPNFQRQSDVPQQSSFNRLNSFNSSLIPSLSQIPLPPSTPDHCPSNNSTIQMQESQMLPLTRSVNFKFPLIGQTPCPSYSSYPNQVVIAPPQRRVIDCQSNRWSQVSFTNNVNKVSLFSQDFFASQQFSQHIRNFETVNNSLMDHEIPHITLRQNLQPRYNFFNDELPKEWMF